MNPQITIQYDEEGFLGSQDATGIDADASREKYERALIKALRQEFGASVDITVQYGPTMQVSEYRDKDGDYDEANSITVQDIEGRVYADGAFWVTL